MSKNIMNATYIRNNFFRIYDLVAQRKEPIFIKKDKQVLVKLDIVGNELKEDWTKTKKLLDETRGILNDETEEQIKEKFEKADKLSTRRIRARNW